MTATTTRGAASLEPADADADTPDRILARLQSLHPVLIDLSLGRVTALLEALGHPERRLPPVIHVAGTNGKGSTCAFLRAIARRAGLVTHATISPHLVSITERFVVADREIPSEALARALREIERVNAGAAITVFELLIACAMMLFARHPADLAILETGLGGRLDATNVVVPAVSAITSISLDHQDFLGDTITSIAAEKAGILKPGVPAVTGRQAAAALGVLDAAAAARSVRLLARDRDWSIEAVHGTLRFEDPAGRLDLPLPSLRGGHQIDNAGIAIAACRASGLPIPDAAFDAVADAVWPARLERLTGRLARRSVPPGTELWVDGGHNPGAASALARHLETWHDRSLALVVGMKRSKDAAGFLAPLLDHADAIVAVAEPDQDAALGVDEIIEASGGRAVAGPDLDGAFARLAPLAPGRVLVCGSLYLAGIVLVRDRGHA